MTDAQAEELTDLAMARISARQIVRPVIKEIVKLAYERGQRAVANAKEDVQRQRGSKNWQ